MQLAAGARQTRLGPSQESQTRRSGTTRLARDTRASGLLVRPRTSTSPSRPPPIMPRNNEQQPEAAAAVKQQWLAKTWNFLLGASGAFIFPYINVYLAQRGMSSAQIGMLAALRPWLGAPVSMTASALADKHRIHTKLLLASCAVAVLLRSSLPLTNDLWPLFGVLLLSELIGAPTGVLGDSTVLSNCKDPGDYGKQRQWASIGWGMCSLPAGWLITQAGLTSAFLAYGLTSIPLLLVGSQLSYNYQSLGLSAAPTEENLSKAAAAAAPAAETTAETAAAGSIVAAQPAAAEAATATAAAAGDKSASFQQLLLQPAVLTFLWRCCLMGFGMGVMSTYEFLFLKQLGAPETLMGMALVMNVATEVPAFNFQGAILKRISAPTVLNLVLAVTSLRLGCYAALPAVGNPWAVLPVELLHGVTFGLGFCTATVYSSKLAPPNLAATMQGLFQATYAGIGAGLGGLAGGFLMEQQGGQGLFLTAAGIVAAGGLLGAVADQAVSMFGQSKGQELVKEKAQ